MKNVAISCKNKAFKSLCSLSLSFRAGDVRVPPQICVGLKRVAVAAGGWRADVTVAASSAAWANRCAHSGHRSAVVCASRVMTFAVTSPLAPFVSLPPALRPPPHRIVPRCHRYTRYGFNIAEERARSGLSYAAAGHPCE